MHLTEGELQAYYDQETQTGERASIDQHLAICPRCRTLAVTIQNRRAVVNSCLAQIKPGRNEIPGVESGRAALNARQHKHYEERQTMLNKLLGRSWRPVWAVLTFVVVFAVALAFPPVRALATSFLGLFRVQQVAVVPINPANLPGDMKDIDSTIEQLIADTATYQVNGESQTVQDAEEASLAAGIDVRLPDGVSGDRTITVRPGAQGEIKVDLPRVRAILDEMGRGDIQLPEQLDQAVIEVDVPPAVTTTYGDCQARASELPEEAKQVRQNFSGEGCIGFIQLASPTVNAPDDLDVNQLGEAFLRLSGMSEAEAKQFSQKINWSNTLVIPVPTTHTRVEDVQVDGVTGTLVREDPDSDHPEYVLIWAKNGLVYAISGVGDSSQAVQMANSLK